MPSGRSSAIVLFVFLVAPCAPGAIDKAKAVALATAAASDSTVPVSLVSAETGTYGEFVPGHPPDSEDARHPVWAVKLRGLFQLEGVFPLGLR